MADHAFGDDADSEIPGTYIDFSTPQSLVDSSPLHRIALWALLTELDRCPLRWSASDEPAGDMSAVVRDLVTRAMGAGYAVWRVHSGDIEIGDTADFELSRRRPGGRWTCKPTGAALGAGWKVSVFRGTPFKVTNPTPWDWASPSRDSAQHIRRLEQQLQCFASRDRHNSAPACFTAYSTLKSSQSNHDPVTYPWNNEPGGAGGTYGVDDERTLTEAIQRRADTIRRLDAAAAARKNEIMQHYNNPDAMDATEAQWKMDYDAPDHHEHSVADNAAYKETKQLISLVDARYHHERARHGVFYALGIPPQAIGESVTSERTAANLAQYDVAISLFQQTVKSYRSFVGMVLRLASIGSDGNHLVFKPSLSRTSLVRMMPYLKPAAAAEMLAIAYDIPPEFIDHKRVAAAATDPATGKPTGKPAAPAQRAPENVPKKPSDYVVTEIRRKPKAGGAAKP